MGPRNDGWAKVDGKKTERITNPPHNEGIRVLYVLLSAYALFSRRVACIADAANGVYKLHVVIIPSSMYRATYAHFRRRGDRSPGINVHHRPPTSVPRKVSRLVLKVPSACTLTHPHDQTHVRLANRSLPTADWPISEIYRRSLEYSVRSESGAASRRPTAFRVYFFTWERHY